MNKVFIEKIIKDALDGLPYNFEIENADVSMVALAFLNGTNMYGANARRAGRYGMMAMPEKDLQDTVNDLIKFGDLEEHVFNSSMVACLDFTNESVLEAAEYNIAFQAIVTYVYLFNKNGGKPSTIVDAIDVYHTHWDDASNQSKRVLGNLLGEYSRRI